MRSTSLLILALSAVVLSSCRETPQSEPMPSPAPIPPTSEATAPLTSAPSIPDAWLGKWIGPEGTFLVLSQKGEGYEILIQSLDGPNTYAGVAVGGHLEFQRDGKTESIRAGSGQETGMKWLLEKKDCLVIRSGEGFCRD
jgi:hypothetical protein